jgi:hypothetical protein
VTTANSGTLEVLADLTTGTGNPVGTSSATPSSGGGSPSQVTVPSTTVPRITLSSG